MIEKEYADRCIRQYQAHTKKIQKDEIQLIRIDSGLWDAFYGTGWKNQSRFRIFKLKTDKRPRLICVSGLHISADLREILIKECSNNG